MSLKNLWLMMMAVGCISCNFSLDPEDKPLKEDKVVEAEKAVKKMKAFSGSRDDLIEYMGYRLIEAKRLLELPLDPLRQLKLNNKNPNVDSCQIVKAYVPSDRGSFLSIESVNCRPKVCLNTKKTQNCHLFPHHLNKVVNAIERYESWGLGDWPERLSYGAGKYDVVVKARGEESSKALFTEDRYLDARFLGLDDRGLAQYDVYYEVTMGDIEQKIRRHGLKVDIFGARQQIYISAVFVVDPVSLGVVEVNKASIELRGQEPSRWIQHRANKKRRARYTSYNDRNHMKVTMHTRFVDDVCHTDDEGVQKCRRQKIDHPVVIDLCGMGFNRWQVKFKGEVGVTHRQKSEYKSYPVSMSSTEVSEQEGRCGPKAKPARNVIHYGLFFLK